MFPERSQSAAFCLCEVSTFGLSLHSPARGAKDTFLLGAPGCKIYSVGPVGFFPHLAARSFDTIVVSYESPRPSLVRGIS